MARKSRYTGYMKGLQKIVKRKEKVSTRESVLSRLKSLKDLDQKRTVSKVKESVKTRIKANAEKAEQAPKRNKSAKTKEERA